MKLPKGWRRHQFDDVASIQEGQVSPLKEPYCSMIHIGPDSICSGGGLVGSLRTCQESGLTSGKYYFRPGAIVYSKIRPNLNKVCLVDFEGLCSADAYPIYPKNNLVEPKFMLHTMRSATFVKKAIGVSMRSGMPKINRDDLGCIEIVVPPLPEQRKIAEILSAWDEAFTKLAPLIEAQERRKMALMQQLLTGKKRMPRFANKPWKKAPMGEMLTRVFRPIDWSAEMSLSLVSLRRRCGGLFRRPIVLGSGYKTQDLHELKADDFLISKRQVAHGAWGLVTPEFAGSHVSKEYAILVNTAPEKLFMPYFAWLCQTPRMIHLSRVASTGVHIEKLIFDPGVFLRNSVLIPPTLEEQKHIADILDAADQELTLLRAQRSALDQQKRGLMQRLLTGKIRVKL